VSVVTSTAERIGRIDWRAPRTVGIAGIVLGCLAFWLALPPLQVDAAWLPVLVGVLAIACGIWAISRGVRRIGWFAIVIGVFGIALGLLAIQSSDTKLEVVVSWSALFAAMLRYATPLTFAAIGGMFSERAGVVNIGLEGMMLSGAFFGIWAADATNSWVLGVAGAMASGAAFALLHAFFAIHLRADQIVGGTAVNFLALGITGYLYIDHYGDEGTPTDLPEIPQVHLAFLEDWYFVGAIFGNLNLMIWVSFAVLVLSYLVLFKMPIGLRIRACGEHPRAADTVGISVYGVRYAAVVVSGMLAALGGAYLSMGFVHSFSENMTAGRGFIALAAVIFGAWRPAGAFAAALLFGFSSALAQRLPEYTTSGAVLFQSLPYVLTLIAVAGIIGRSIPPAAVGRPYVKQ
jgi:general nucleoside transport system permease protein